MILTPPPKQHQLRLLSNQNDDDYKDDNEDSSENDLNNDRPLRCCIHRKNHHRRISSFHSITTLTWKFYFDRLSLFMLQQRRRLRRLRRRRRSFEFLLLLVVVCTCCRSSKHQPDITSSTTNERMIYENIIFGTVHAYTFTTTNLLFVCDRRHRYCPLRKERPRSTLPLFATYQTNRHSRNEDNDCDSIVSSTFIPSTVSSTNSTTITEHTTPIAAVVVGIRLNKVFTKLYSRRSTDTLIRDGRIQVNDEIVTDLGRRVIPYRDIIRLDSEIYCNWEEHITTTTINDKNHNNNKNNNQSRNTATTQQQSISSSSSSFITAESTNNEITTTKRLDDMEHHDDDDNDAQDHPLPLPLPPPHPTTDGHVYIKYWKPVGVISTTDRNVPNNLIDAIYHGVTSTTTSTTRENQNHQRHQSQSLTSSSNPNVQQLQNGRRIFNVGRLDKDSSGLLLLTSDGRVPNIVLSKQFVHTKVYYVVLDKPITYEHIQQLRHGILITTDTIRQRKHVSYTAKTLPCQVEPLYNMNDNSDAKRRYSETDLWYNDDTIEASSSSSYIPTTELQITLIEGRNRQIRIMLQSVGSYRVLELHRTQFMSTIDLTNLHHPGDWTYLNTTELTSLQRAITSSSLQRGSTSDNNDTFIRQQSSKSLLW